MVVVFEDCDALRLSEDDNEHAFEIMDQLNAERLGYA
jgi:hypothetical protein